MNKIIEAAGDVRFNNKAFWENMQDFIIYSTQYEFPRDILETLELLIHY